MEATDIGARGGATQPIEGPVVTPERSGHDAVLLIRDARVLTLDDAGTIHDRADILIRDGRIQTIGADLPSPSLPYMELDGRHKLAMPGLVNAHVHTTGTFNRGAFPLRPLEVFMLYEVPPFDFGPFPPALDYARSLYSAVEMLRLGITSVQDDPFFVPHPTADSVDAVMRAYRDAGIRATVTVNQPNRVEYEKYPYLKELLPDDLTRAMDAAPRMPTADILDLYVDVIARWHGTERGRLRIAVSCSAPQRATEDYMLGLEDLSRRHGLSYNLHILETKAQRVTGRERYGTSLIQYAASLGLLSPRTTVIHAVWVDAADMETLARHGASVAHNPISNLRLGSGVMPFRGLRDHGVNICLGTDEATTDDTHNLWIVGKLCGMIHTLSDTDYRRWPAPAEVLHALTRGGARSMLQDRETGRLAPGYRADIQLLNLRTPAFVPLNDLHSQLVFCETGSSVDTVIVDGRIVVRDGKVHTVDEEALRQSVEELMPRYREHYARALRWVERLEPYYAEVYRRCAAQDVGFSRWLAGPQDAGTKGAMP